MPTEIKHTTCAYCGVGCGIEATVNSTTRKVHIKGDGQHPANLGRLCSKGTALGDTLELEGRLLNPKINGQTADWDNALDTVAKGFADIIEEHGPDAVAFYLSGQLLTEDYYVANKLMKGFIGSANIDTNSRLCMSSSVVGHKRAFGTDTVPGCYEDFEHSDLIVLVGSNTAWCHPVLFQRIKLHKEQNPNVKVVVIDPRKTATCEIADLHLPIQLGADVALFNGLLQYLDKNEYIDTQYVQAHCEGFDQARACANEAFHNLHELSNVCGLDIDAVNTFYQWFAETEKTVTLYSQGVNQSSSGTDKVNAIINCHLATGRIGRLGMGPFSMTGQPNAMGGREVGGLANTLAAHMDFEEDNIDRLNRFWNTDRVPPKAGLTAVDLFDAIDEGKIKAVWIMATNPVVSMPNANKVKSALEKCPLVVVSDCIAHTDTTRLATVALPATGWSEKDGTVTNSERRISRQRALLIPAGNARHDWWIISQVAKRMGFKSAFNYQTPAEIFKEHALLSGFENTTISQSKNSISPNQYRRRDFDISGLAHLTSQEYEHLQPIQWPVTEQNPNGTQRFFAAGEFYTASRKARFIAVQHKTPAHRISTDYPYKLNSGRIRDQWHTMTRTSLAPQLNQHIRAPYLEMHPDDAHVQSMKAGQIIRIESTWGKMLAKLSITPDTQKGHLFAPMHWTDELSRNGRVGPVINPAVDPISFQPESKHTPVKIEKFLGQWEALILTREKITVQEAEYQVYTKGDAHWQLQLSDEHSIDAPLLKLKEWLNIADTEDASTQSPQEVSYLHFEDLTQGVARIAGFNSNGTLNSIGFFQSTQQATHYQLPEVSWLSQQFKKDHLDDRSRAAILSGFAPIGEDMGAIICACFSVGEKSICKAIKEQSLTDTAGIGKTLKAGTNCGSCLPELRSLLAESAC